MAVFISYSSRDRALVEGLLTALRRARQPAWLDEELSGGEAWWRAILEQIRDCEVFIVALSKNMLESKACQAELRYAQELDKAILPVQIGPLDNLRINPLAHMQVIDYRNPTIESGIELVSTVQARRSAAKPLPDPLPEEPPIPFAYLMRLASTISGPSLTAPQQSTLVAELKAGLEEDGDDASARGDITQLLCMLRDRNDVTWRTRTEVEAVLASLQSPPPSTPQPPPPPANAPPPPPYRPPPSGPPPGHNQHWNQPPTGPTGFSPGTTGPVTTTKPSKSRAKWLIGGGATAAALIAVIVVAVILNQPKPIPPPPPPPPAVEPGALSSLLLTPDEINSIMNTENLEPGEIYTAMTTEPPAVSDPACTGAQFNAVQSVYQGSGYSTVADQALTGDNPVYTYVNQTAILFPSAAQADAFVKSSADAWQRCAGQTVTATMSDGSTYNWTFDDVKETDSQIAQTTTQEGMGGYGCEHVLRVVSNAILEVQACQDDISNQAETMTDKMADKAPV